MNIILDPGAFMPEFAHKTDAGADLRSPVCDTVPARGSVVIDTFRNVKRKIKCCLKVQLNKEMT